MTAVAPKTALRTWIDLCLTFPGAWEDYPFDAVTPVIKHRENGKMFVLLREQEGRVLLNLKCDPAQADFFRQIYQDVTPGYHMNKTHWNTVKVDGDTPLEELYRMIADSYDLTKPKVRPGRSNQ